MAIWHGSLNETSPKEVHVVLWDPQCTFTYIIIYIYMYIYVFGGMYFYHNMFIVCHCPTRHLAQVFITANCTAIASLAACGAATHLAPEKGRAGLRGGRHVLWLWVGCLFGGVRFVLLLHACSLCSLGAVCCWFACLLCAVLRFCLVSSCYNEALLLVRVSAGRGQLLCPWDRGDKKVSCCWWVRACFIHPETLFQTLSQVISRRIRPRLAPRTPF